jgi:Leucine-rich repeat (LRR) protein
MALWKILAIICATAVYAESKWNHHYKREISSSICSTIQNNTNKINCYCGQQTNQISTAECYQVHKNISKDDPSWDGFQLLQNVSRLTLTNTRGVAMNYIPTKALKYTKAILRLDVKYCNIERLEPYAFANLSLVEELSLRDNQIKSMTANAFSHHARLKIISLDQNNIAEINRNVFVDLPSLEQLFLTANKITTIHDKAFVHLSNLKELEIDKNSLFSLNSETFSGLRNLEKLELSSNSLEVIGDNTFAPLVNLRLLNLGENKIQMLDEKAFNGLSRLQILSLDRNRLSAIENVKIFEGLQSLTSLNLKGNEITVIKPEAFLPILSNFYGKTSQLNIDGMYFATIFIDLFRIFLLIDVLYNFPTIFH